jgi:hypothetical protein
VAGLSMSDEEFEDLVKDMTFFEGISMRFRYFLWCNFVDHILLIKMGINKDKGGQGNFMMKKPDVQDYGIFSLLQASVLSIS